MQVVETTEATHDLLLTAADPDHPLHNVYLLTELRKLNKQVSHQYIQKFKSEMVKRFVEGQKTNDCHELSSVLKSKVSKRRSIIVDDSGAGDSRQVHDNRNSFPPRNSRSSTRTVNSTSKSSTTILNNFSDSSLHLNVISDFFSTIELISKFYNISSDEEFVRNRKQLMDTLGLLKNYKVYNDVSNNLVTNFRDLCDMKRRFNGIIGEDISTLYTIENF